MNLVRSSENNKMTSDKKEETTSNKTEKTNEIRITLEADHPVVSNGPDPEIAEITIQVPEKYRDFEITGIQHIKGEGVSYEDTFGIDRPIMMKEWFKPVFSDNMFDLINADIRDLLDVSLINQKQNQTMFKLLSNSIYRKKEDLRQRSEQIHSTKKTEAESINASISSK